MSNWVPEGSVAYDLAFADEGHEASSRGMLDQGSVPYFSTLPPPAKRDAKRCIGNDHTCKGYKLKGQDYCVGHMKSKAKKKEADSGNEDS